ncbi:MGH1-like glycoside hydrolase domain-containing protein [Tundrisphaera lichenicola]|uniref:MGH1-like glycoside hydrolase domain-containing protein n=1 Tax=Tundrisphaera lichenicola TaxID=2029860 RepID=UPI003EBC8693
MANSVELQRLSEISDGHTGWRRWGTYVADRAWGTVREDYSVDGDAWAYFTHEQARSKAYRWGEDGIAGLCDRYQLIVFAFAFWNERDRILKERLFGLSNPEGNHGEDVKEYYFYLDATPTHSYSRFLYKYPQREFPYQDLIDENARRGTDQPEYELLDTGIFDEDRYFDIEIEYGKVMTDDIVIRITATNRGPDPAPLHILPHLWFRNTWGWGEKPGKSAKIYLGESKPTYVSLVTDDSMIETLSNVPLSYQIGSRNLYGPSGGRVMFTENETNQEQLYGVPNHGPHVKDAFHRHIIHGEKCLKSESYGSKSAIQYRFDGIPPGESVTLRFRLTDTCILGDPLAEVDSILAQRKIEADEYYDTIHPPDASDDDKLIQRQALAGLIWTKQAYLYDVDVWLKGDNPDWPPPVERQHIRNDHWKHINSMRVMTVCDKWEYPWFAAWDLAFQCVPFALVDPDFAKHSLWVLLFEQFQHPNGQIPAYEWEFSDLNPPVHAWAVWRVYNMDRLASGKADRDWLERCFHKLLMNFAWWINKVDREGNNVFEGGFLGLDNITVVDRSRRCEDGSTIEQSDATGWMGMFCLNLMRIALELAKENSTYEALATKFFQHYTYVAAAMKHMGNKDYSLWDEEDGFFYDVLRYPDGRYHKLRVRSLVGLIPLFAVERLEEEWMKPFSVFSSNFHWFLKHRPEQVKGVVHTVEHEGGLTHALTILDKNQIRRILNRVMDPTEFLSDYGVRSLSKAHKEHPFYFDGQYVGYEPTEALVRIKGGNSNWRGPLWFPTSFLLIESLRKLGKAFGNDVGDSDNPGVPFNSMAREIAQRMISTFRQDERGRRPVFTDSSRFQDDPHWRNNLLFYEYFNGDSGAGLGASHQTGWTALIASLIDEWTV